MMCPKPPNSSPSVVCLRDWGGVGGVKGKQMRRQPQLLLHMPWAPRGSHHMLSFPPAAHPRGSHPWLCPGGREPCNPARTGRGRPSCVPARSLSTEGGAGLRLGVGLLGPQGAQTLSPCLAAHCPQGNDAGLSYDSQDWQPTKDTEGHSTPLHSSNQTICHAGPLRASPVVFFPPPRSMIHAAECLCHNSE